MRSNMTTIKITVISCYLSWESTKCTVVTQYVGISIWGLVYLVVFFERVLGGHDFDHIQYTASQYLFS